jgi:hypothetical protein
MAEQPTILGGKVYIYKRPYSTFWQCSSFFAGKNRRVSTKEESLAKAKDIAEDWYLRLRGKFGTGEIKAEKTFREVPEHFLREYEIITRGERSKQHVDGQYLPSSSASYRFICRLAFRDRTPRFETVRRDEVKFTTAFLDVKPRWLIT